MLVNSTHTHTKLTHDLFPFLFSPSLSSFLPWESSLSHMWWCSLFSFHLLGAVLKQL